jgi:hypothetical protein
MNNKIVLSFTILCMIAVGFESVVEAIGDYAFTYTNGSNQVAFRVIRDTGKAFQLRQGGIFTSSTPIGTTSPRLVTEGGVRKVWVYHTFRNPATGRAVYGIAKFNLSTGQLEAALPVPNFAITGFHPLVVFSAGTQSRSMSTRSLDLITAILKPTGPPGPKKIAIINRNAQDALTSAEVPRDGQWIFQTVQKMQGTTIFSQIQARKLVAGRGTGTLKSLSDNVTVYSLAASNAIETTSAGGSKPAALVRYLAGRVFRNLGTSNQQSQILVQQLDNATGNAIGQPKPFTNFQLALIGPAESLPSVAVAEDGSFILYTIWSNACSKQILVARRLNPRTGTPVGPQKILVNCNGLTNIAIPGFYGIDIVRLPS